MKFKKMCSCCLEESDEITQATLTVDVDALNLVFDKEVWLCKDCLEVADTKSLAIATLKIERK